MKCLHFMVQTVNGCVGPGDETNVPTMGNFHPLLNLVTVVNLHEALLSPGDKSSYSACSNGALCLGLMGDLQQEGSNDGVT